MYRYVHACALPQYSLLIQDASSLNAEPFRQAKDLHTGQLNTPATCTPRALLSGPRPRRGHTFGNQQKREPLRVAHMSQGLGSDVAGGFLDLANLVSSGGNSQRTPYDDLAYRLGT